MATYEIHDELDDRPARESNVRRRRASVFGFLSAVVGAKAVAVALRDRLPDVPFKEYLYAVPQYDYAVQAYHVAAVGAALAVLALLWRRVSGRTRAGWPVLGLLLCGTAAGVYRYETSPRYPGSPEHWVQVNVVERAQQMLNKGQAPVQPTAQPPAPAETSASTPADAGTGSSAAAPQAGAGREPNSALFPVR